MNLILVALLAFAVLILAVTLDLFLGDPSPNYPEKLMFKIHPTVLMGRFARAIEPYFKSKSSRLTKLGGVVLALIVIGLFTVPVYFGLWAISTVISVFAYAFLAIILLKFSICIKLETDWAKAATIALQQDDLTEAKKYSHFSRRDSKDLTGTQVTSAVIESMAENLIDFKISPILSYAFLGVSGAVAFRAVNTLDGTVGFKDSEHLHIGWFSANLDHWINFIPSRLTGILIVASAAILGEDYKNAWAMARRDHSRTPSRNHGWPMAAMAGALRVQLEKPGQYVLGEKNNELSPEKILVALRIRNVAIILCVLLSLPIILFTRWFFFPF